MRGQTVKLTKEKHNWKWGLALSIVLWGMFALVYTGVINLNL